MISPRREGLCSVGHEISWPSYFEGDLIVDDGDALLLHFRRHGSLSTAQVMCDDAVAGLASWRAGRQAWAGAQHHKASGAVPCYVDGPLYEHRRRAIPQGLLAMVDRLAWEPGLTGAARFHLADRYADGYGQNQRLHPDLTARLLAAADEQLATAPFGITVEHAAAAYLTHRRPDGTQPHDNHLHVDGAYDPRRRWVSAIFYFTAADGYQGGDLIIGPTGERVRPDRGDVVVLRGDVEHQVEPVTLGSRTTLTAHAAECRWWIEPRDELEAAGDPDERCRILDRLFRAGLLDRPALRRGVALTWNACHHPEHHLTAERWVPMLRAAGFLAQHAGNVQPTEPLEVFRACNPGDERRMTWTPSLDTARGFQRNFGRTELWRAGVPPDAVLGLFGVDEAIEVVVDPSRLTDLTLIG